LFSYRLGLGFPGGIAKLRNMTAYVNIALQLKAGTGGAGKWTRLFKMVLDFLMRRL